MNSANVRFSLWATDRAKTGRNDYRSAQLHSHLDGTRVARRHCSTLRPDNTILSPLCPAGIGHFYFGLTASFFKICGANPAKGGRESIVSYNTCVCDSLKRAVNDPGI